VNFFVSESVPAIFLVQKEWREKREDFKKKVRRIVRKSQEML
jgi:ubiquitin-conjugating enzyme E2 G1